MKKKYMAALVSLLLASTVMAGCGDDAGGSAEGNNTLQNVLQSGTLKAGVLTDSKPMSYTNEDGKRVGFEVDTAQALADALGVKLEMVDVTSAERIPALETHKIDIIVGSLTRNTNRAAKLAFSDPYVATASKLVLPKDSELNSNSKIEEFKGKTVGTVKGTSTAEDLQKVNQDNSINVLLTDTSAELPQALDNHQIDAYVVDGTIADYRVKEAPDKYKAGPAISDPFYNCLGVRLDDTIWLNYVNTFIKEKNKDHFFNTLYNKYFGTDMPYSLTPIY